MLAHEFTHCVTHSVMTYNAYMNDYGAINEAISDIQGNLCDAMYVDETEVENEDWLIGEDIGAPIRSMSDPHRFQQPEYTWDLHYVPEVRDPTELNDRGGVHGNSSLLNHLAWQLCEKGGMSPEEARAYWFAVDCTMVPGTDYAQLADLMPWVLKNLGMERYDDALTAAVDATRIRTADMPDTFDDDRALLTLTLPDTEQFTDGNWALGIFSINLDGLLQRCIDIIDRAPGYETALDELVRAIDPESTASGEDLPRMIEEMIDSFFEEPGDGEALEDGEAEEASEPVSATAIADSEPVKWLRQYFGDMIFSGLGAAGQDGRTVQMMCRPGMTIPVLVRLEFKPNSMQLKTSALAVYIGRWIDLGPAFGEIFAKMNAGEDLLDEDGGLTDDVDMGGLDSFLEMLEAYTADMETGEDVEPEADEQMEPLTLEDLRGLLVDMKAKLDSYSWLQHLFLYEIKPGQVNTLRDTGLNDVTVLDEEHSPALFEMAQAIEDTENAKDAEDAQ